MDNNYSFFNEPYRNRAQTWGGQVRVSQSSLLNIDTVANNNHKLSMAGPASCAGPMDDDSVNEADVGMTSILDLDLDMVHCNPDDKIRYPAHSSTSNTTGIADPNTAGFISSPSSGNSSNCGQIRWSATSSYDVTGADGLYQASQSNQHHSFGTLSPSGSQHRNNFSPMSSGESLGGSLQSANAKKNARKNPWGHETYADMIAKAIESSPDQKATLQQVYEYISAHYQYFRDRSDAASSSGWKNSIRHNLSLHDKFIKCAKSNDNAKSCFWVVNHEAIRKPYMRRRASSMDTNKAVETAKKVSLLRKRMAANQQQRSNLDGTAPYVPSTTPNPESTNFGDFTYYRQRSGSNVSLLSYASRTSDVSTAGPPGLEAEVLHTSPPPGSDQELVDGPGMSMDRISEELCLEVVRRVVFGEDEADLLIYSDNPPTSKMAKSTDSKDTSERSDGLPNDYAYSDLHQQFSMSPEDVKPPQISPQVTRDQHFTKLAVKMEPNVEGVEPESVNNNFGTSTGDSTASSPCLKHYPLVGVTCSSTSSPVPSPHHFCHSSSASNLSYQLPSDIRFVTLSPDPIVTSSNVIPSQYHMPSTSSPSNLIATTWS